MRGRACGGSPSARGSTGRRPSSCSSPTPARHRSRRTFADLRSVLHDPRRRRRHGPRPQHLLRHRARPRRTDRGREQGAGRGRCSRILLPARVDGRRRGRAGARRARRTERARLHRGRAGGVGLRVSSPPTSSARRWRGTARAAAGGVRRSRASLPPTWPTGAGARRHAGVPLVLVSMAAEDGDVERFGREQASAVLAPPFQLRALAIRGPRGRQGVCMTGPRPLLVSLTTNRAFSSGRPVRAARRLRSDRVLRRPRGDRAYADAQRRCRDGRSADARHRRTRRAARDPRDRSALPGRADDRLRVGRHRGRSGQARRDGLPEQAARLRAARAAARGRARGDRAAPQRAVDRGRPRPAAGVLRHDRPRPGDAGAVRHDSAAGAARAYGARSPARPAPARSSSPARCTSSVRAAIGASSR